MHCMHGGSEMALRSKKNGGEALAGFLKGSIFLPCCSTPMFIVWVTCVRITADGSIRPRTFFRVGCAM